MNIQQIRNKYKSILDEDCLNQNNHKNQSFEEDQKSERQWINIVKQQKQKRILTESAINKQNITKHSKDTKKPSTSIKKTPTKMSTQQTIIDLKQKLAQSLLNCSRKDSQISDFQEVVLRKNQQIKLHLKSISELKKVIQEKDSLIFQQRLNQEKLHHEITSRDNSIEEMRIQNQLLKKHIENYAKQLQSTNFRFQEQQKRFDKIAKEKQKVDHLKSKIDKLKDDVKRLKFLLSDFEGYAPVMMALQGKHFLGKPSKESKELQYWYPEVLITGLQKFLKKQQIAYGNKVFTQNLAKFIYGMLERSQKTGERKVKSKYHSRIKQIQRKKNQILNAFQSGIHDDTKRLSATNCRLNASSLRKTTTLNGSSQLKTRDFSVCLQKSLIFDRQKQGLFTSKNVSNRDSKVDKRKSFIIEGLERSVKMNQNHKKHILMELIKSFVKGVQKLFKLQNKTLVQQKISALCDWLKQSVAEIYQTNKLLDQSEYNETGKWKTLGNL